MLKLYYKISFEFDYLVLSGRLRIKHICESDNTRQSRMAPYTRDVDIKNDSCRKGEREIHLQNNIKVKLEQLKLSKTDMSTWT
jgi:hypothetical protein